MAKRRGVPVRPDRSAASRELKALIAKFRDRDQVLIRSVRAAVRRRLPAANELVYDNYNFFVIGYSASERPSEAILSIAARANAVSLCFLHGARLPDPDALLSGGGKQVRFMRLESAAVLARPGVVSLIRSAIARSPVPFRSTGRGQLIIRSISARQRPRQKPLTAGRQRRT